MRAATLLVLASPALAFKLTGSIQPNPVLNSTSFPLESRLEVDFETRVPFRADAMLYRDSTSSVLSYRGTIWEAWVSILQLPTDVQYIVTIPDEEALKAAAVQLLESAESQAENEATAATGSGGEPKSEPKPKSLVHVQTYYPNRQALPVSSASLPYPLKIYAFRKEEYYTSAPGMQLLTLLKSPMVLLMIGTSIMAFFLPRITASLENDPEMAKDLAEARRRVNSVMSGDMGSQLANRLVGDSDTSQPATPPAAGGGGSGGSSANRGGGGKRGGKRR